MDFLTSAPDCLWFSWPTLKVVWPSSCSVELGVFRIRIWGVFLVTPSWYWSPSYPFRCLRTTRTAWCVSGPSFPTVTPYATTLRQTTPTFPSLPSTAATRPTQNDWLALWRTPCVIYRSCCSRLCRAAASTVSSRTFCTSLGEAFFCFVVPHATHSTSPEHLIVREPENWLQQLSGAFAASL